MLAPMIIGTAIEIGKPPATIPTITEVIVLEDWISAVAKIPMISPMKGLVAKAKILSAPSFPPAAQEKPALIMPTPRRRI